ncbi:MAG: PspC domain-containing protein [Pseudomonadota bacterium]
MTERMWNSDHGRFRGFYRDRENGWIFGVCAGLADRLNLRVGAVRAIAAVCLLLFFWVTALVYILAAVLIREKPLIYSGRASEHEFWCRRGDRWRRS